MTQLEQDFATVREALNHYGTWRMQKPRREAAKSALDRIAAICEVERDRGDLYREKYDTALALCERQREALEAVRDVPATSARMAVEACRRIARAALAAFSEQETLVRADESQDATQRGEKG